jgi:hypothetical protein
VLDSALAPVSGAAALAAGGASASGAGGGAGGPVSGCAGTAESGGGGAWPASCAGAWVAMAAKARAIRELDKYFMVLSKCYSLETIATSDDDCSIGEKGNPANRL